MKIDLNKLKQRFRNIKSPYRFQIIDVQTYDVRWAVVLSKLKIILYFASSIFVLFLIAYFSFGYTPLKKILPKTNSLADNKREIINLRLRTAELEEKVRIYGQYYENIDAVFKDSIGMHEDFAQKNRELTDEPPTFPKPSQLELKYRTDFEALLQKDKNHKDLTLYLLNSMHHPVEGKPIAVEGEELQSKTIKIKAKDKSGVYAVLDGTVLAKYISGDKSHLYLIHENNIVSIYKFDGDSEVSQGEQVQKGQLLGTFDEKGEHTISFDLWVDTEQTPAGQFLKF